MARTYKRDGNGRFAGGGGSSGGGGSKRPAAKSVSRGVNRLTRDNAGKITSVGGSGATARGGRLKTAAGNKRAMQTAKVSGVSRAGTMKGRIKRDPGAAGKAGQAKPAASKPALNKIAASPRQLSKNEQIARDVMTNKTFKSDRQRVTEMQRRGIKPDTDIVGLVANVRAKQGGGTTSKIKPASKPAATKQSKRKAVGAISEAKAGRIIARMDANRPGLRPASGSNRKTTNAIKTHNKASDFALAASSRARKQGKNLSVNESLQRGVKNANKAAAAKRKPKPTNAAPKTNARPLSQRETQNLVLAKSNLAISKERLAFAREAKTKAKGPLEKLKATDRINEQQSNIRQINNKITGINARPAPGRPITGADRSGNRKQLSASKKSGAIKGSIKRDASAPSNLKNKSALNAGKYKNIYMANANKAAAAKRKRNP